MTRGRVQKVMVTRWQLDQGAPGTAGDHSHTRREPDVLIVEEPLEIRLDGALVGTTMRTPGHDFELAVGFCHAEGLLAHAHVQRCRYCGTGSAVATEFNVVSVETGGTAAAPEPRVGTTGSACGLCGSVAIEALVERLHPLVGEAAWDLAVLASVPESVMGRQELFTQTGAVHAAATFDRDGTIGHVREDIGRHNAVDKVVGALVLAGELPRAAAEGWGLFVSGRASFEMVQKAWAAGFSAVVAVSAPSALAVETARRANITLTGFTRPHTLNRYTP